MSGDGEDSVGYAFTCPACDEQLETNKPMRDTLIERGCVVCGTSVTPEAFTEHSFADSS
jgi:Zn ribbon nucleic-acid-binding protein